MSNVFDVANYILGVTQADHLKLQKLLFYTQAVCLVVYNQEAFKEKIEAWEYGPVVKEVYKKYQKTEGPLAREHSSGKTLTPEVIQSADLVVGHYGKKTGPALIQETHSEAPWQEAFKKGRNTVITVDSIKDYYSKIYSIEEND